MTHTALMLEPVYAFTTPKDCTSESLRAMFLQSKNMFAWMSDIPQGCTMPFEPGIEYEVAEVLIEKDAMLDDHLLLPQGWFLGGLAGGMLAWSMCSSELIKRASIKETSAWCLFIGKLDEPSMRIVSQRGKHECFVVQISGAVPVYNERLTCFRKKQQK